MTGSAGEGRVVVVTGANRGLGLEVARQCAARGDSVVLGSRDLAAGRRAAADLGDGVLPVALDVTDPDGLAAAAADVDHAFGRVDVLVEQRRDPLRHLAERGGRRPRRGPGGAGDERPRRLADHPRVPAPAAPQRPPRVVMVSSESGSLASMNGGVPAYAVSKAALNALTRTLAGDLRRNRVLVNAVCPGWTATDMGGRGGRPVDEGAASILWAADLPDDGPTGTFTRDGRPLRW